jgi:hypothetical protein
MRSQFVGVSQYPNFPEFYLEYIDVILIPITEEPEMKTAIQIV